MKKLNKLVISPEKIMKYEELINLHGGYGSNGCDPDADPCEGDCTITVDGKTFAGTCKKVPQVFNKCGCVEND